MKDYNKDKIILHLCAKEGSDSQYYANAGYDRRIIGKEIGVENYSPPKNIYGIIANPDCRKFAVSGARWWTKPESEDGDLQYALFIVDNCLRIITESNPVFWVLENPVGRLKRLRYSILREPRLIYNPCDYGDTYTKKTLLWGKFNIPPKNPVKPKGKNPIHYMSPGKDRADKRSICSLYFAKAFYEANK